MNWLFSVIIPILFVCIEYALFDKSGFRAGAIFTILSKIALLLLGGTLNPFFNQGIFVIIIVFLVAIILYFIVCGIEYFIYNITNSFFTWILLGAIVEFGIVFLVSFFVDFALSLF